MLGYMLVNENARIREQIIHHYIHKLLWCFLYFSRPIDVFFFFYFGRGSVAAAATVIAIAATHTLRYFAISRFRFAK